MDNMDLWNRVSKTNPAHTKELKLGRTITAIDPYRQLESATREFGAAGQGWGWSVEKVQPLPTNEMAVLVRVWVKDTSKYIEQWGQASLYIDKLEKKKDTDLMKKATTDGITKCLSCMGFNADIFLGKFEDNEYVQQMKSEFSEENKPKADPYIATIKRMIADEDIQGIQSAWGGDIARVWPQLDDATVIILNKANSEGKF